MDAVLRAIAIYAILLIVFRIAGKRALSQITTFDFVLILVIGEATQQALLGSDFSITNAALVIVTLLGLDIGLSLVVSRVPVLHRVVEDVPLVIVEDGQMLRERVGKSRVDATDIMEEARRLQGLERMEQIKYAVLERNGGISIIPKG
jgi:uncharacterized membrane protein YcaP (DUF421 family)